MDSPGTLDVCCLWLSAVAVTLRIARKAKYSASNSSLYMKYEINFNKMDRVGITKLKDRF